MPNYVFDNIARKLLIFPLLLAGMAVSAQTPALPRVFTVDSATLAAEKAHPDAEFLKAALHEADRSLKIEPMTVTSKAKTPPSGDKRDYTSLSRYFWPNPDTPNHLPYIRKDGESNPEIKDVPDHDLLTRTNECVRALALGYYLTGDEKYAEHATQMLRVFYLDDKTGMRPNMNYAQYVPGQYDGRGSGVLDARSIAMTVDGLGMMDSAKAWTAADRAAMKTWFSEYYTWLTTSKNGLHEKAAPNNHGSWYAVQETSIAMYLGKTDDVKKVAEFIRDKRIPSQFDAEGMQKYELVRTNSFSYSAFNIEALTIVAQIVAKPTGVDLYAVKPGILTGLNALLPYDAQHPWPHQQIGKGMEDSVCPGLVRAAAHTGEAKYVADEKRFDCKLNAWQTLEAMGKK